MKTIKHRIPSESKRSMGKAVAVSFKTNAEDSTQRPLVIKEFLFGLKKAISNQATAAINESLFFVKVKSRLERIDLRKISHIEAMSDYVRIHTKEKGYTILSTMKSMESKLPEIDFIRVHNSFIVRFDSISEIAEKTLIIEKKIIPISLSYRQNFRRRLNIL